jgi:hypothetical protein
MNKTFEDIYTASADVIAKDDELYELFVQRQIYDNSIAAGFEERLDDVVSVGEAGVWKSHQSAMEIEKSLPRDCESVDDQRRVLSLIAEMLIEYGHGEAARHTLGIGYSLQKEKRNEEIDRLRARVLLSRKDGSKNGKDFDDAEKIFRAVAKNFYSDECNRMEYSRRKFQEELTNILKEKYPLMNIPSTSTRSKVDVWINEAVGEEHSRTIRTGTANGKVLRKELLTKYM